MYRWRIDFDYAVAHIINPDTDHSYCGCTKVENTSARWSTEHTEKPTHMHVCDSCQAAIKSQSGNKIKEKRMNKFWIVLEEELGTFTKHSNRGEAEAQAKRHALSNPGQIFYVLETIGVASTNVVTYHRL